jgi:hypothetical protein
LVGPMFSVLKAELMSELAPGKIGLRIGRGR